ncbi:hypothetical protein D4Z93_11780 [Clostridium fermenticellae]|uniref:B3/B4 tRNA-binding domain-containing protein n=1 Tax=Clostridium fermenticellae TaxID=2068654 RepID=A0A386H663_9CLOT|nr:phenylalanine--tRNA ligase beta subunit-related protein [Clostridium fermenticellae]AYD41156.1 hypothetical protein D4Z93_11780 [Clostridium fermenticellae]
MIDIKIDDRFKDMCKEVSLGYIYAKVKVSDSPDELLKELQNACDELNNNFSITDVSKIPQIKYGRNVYKTTGKDPSRYRLAAEALVRRVLKGKGIYNVNNIVDINNLISLKYFYSIGTYDLDKLKEPVLFTVGDEGDSYNGIGRGSINLSNLPVMSDSIGKFGSPTIDSERTMVTKDTRNMLMCLFFFKYTDDDAKYLEYISELLKKYASAEIIETKIIK